MKISNAEGRKLLAKQPRKQGNEESKLQQSIVKWFRLQYPEYKMLLTAIPNGGNRNAITGAILKREGVVAGYPDLLLAVPKNGYHALFIEVKYGDNQLSPKQKTIIAELREQVYAVRTVWNLEQAQTGIKGYLAEF